MSVIICLCVILLWWVTPLFSGLSSDFDDFIREYPNKYKQLIVIFLNGPFVMLVFGYSWLIFHVFSDIVYFRKFREWLRK